MNRRDFLKQSTLAAAGSFLRRPTSEERANEFKIDSSMSVEEGEGILLKEAHEERPVHDRMMFVAGESTTMWIEPAKGNPGYAAYREGLRKFSENPKILNIYSTPGDKVKQPRGYIRIISKKPRSVTEEYESGDWVRYAPSLEMDVVEKAAQPFLMQLYLAGRIYSGAEICGKVATPYGMIEVLIDKDQSPWAELKELYEYADEVMGEIMKGSGENDLILKTALSRLMSGCPLEKVPRKLRDSLSWIANRLQNPGSKSDIGNGELDNNQQLISILEKYDIDLREREDKWKKSVDIQKKALEEVDVYGYRNSKPYPSTTSVLDRLNDAYGAFGLKLNFLPSEEFSRKTN